MKIMVFDVGGTEIKYSVMDEQMHRTNSGAVPTPQDTQAHFLDAVYRLYAPHKDEVTGIAMALPGFVDNRTGYVSNGGALLYNTATPVGQLLAEKCGCPVILENDGKAAAMAELANGALKDCCNAAVFIIGTGVGGGIIANGQLVRGVHFTAGEYSFVNTNAEAWDAPDQNMACQCSTSNLLKWYRARKALPEGFGEVKARWERGELSARAAGKLLGVTHRSFLLWAQDDGCKEIVKKTQKVKRAG